jgi:DtxR family Mn-dependent transcriptional regulator
MTEETKGHPRRTPTTSPSMEQYIETIAELLATDKVTSISDIADKAGVSRPAASRSVRDLADKNYVEHKAYGYVALTPKGDALAHRLHERHNNLYGFLVDVLGMGEEDANDEACILEHQMEDWLVRRLNRLTGFFQEHPDIEQQWLDYRAQEDE